MASALGLRVPLGIITGVAIAHRGSSGRDRVRAAVLAIFIIALVWTLQSRQHSRLPKLVPLAITLILTMAVCLAFASLAVWALGRVSHSLIVDSTRYQTLYQRAVAWLEDHDISVAGLWAIGSFAFSASGPATPSQPAAPSWHECNRANGPCSD